MTDENSEDSARAGLTRRISTLIDQLQSRMLSLDDGEPEMPGAAEIEKTARAINQLITSMERVDGYYRERSDRPQVGDRLEGEARIIFLRKIKRMVENGILDELDD